MGWGFEHGYLLMAIITMSFCIALDITHGTPDRNTVWVSFLCGLFWPVFIGVGVFSTILKRD